MKCDIKYTLSFIKVIVSTCYLFIYEISNDGAISALFKKKKKKYSNQGSFKFFSFLYEQWNIPSDIFIFSKVNLLANFILLK